MEKAFPLEDTRFLISRRDGSLSKPFSLKRHYFSLESGSGRRTRPFQEGRRCRALLAGSSANLGYLLAKVGTIRHCAFRGFCEG